MTGPGPRTAAAISRAVRSGELSAAEVVDTHLDAIDDRNGQINAFLQVTGDRARAAAEAIDRAVADGADPGPLAGVPVALKDNVCTEGVVTTCGSRMLEGWRAPYDATVVQRLSAAGAVVMGKTNTDEFAMGSSTEYSAFGPTRNPHDPSRVPGGSSGGSAAAVAAGMVPVALGTDTGGSIRQPAALCGVVGVKPTYGTVSRYGIVALASSLDHVGPLGADVTDAALLLSAIAGHDPHDSTCSPDPLPDVTAHLEDGVEGLRVGVIGDLLGDGIAPDVAARVRAAGEALAGAGATVRPVDIPQLRHALGAYRVISAAEASSNLARFDGVRFGLRVDAPTTEEMIQASRTAGFGAEAKRRVILGTYLLSAGQYDTYYQTARRARRVIAEAFSDVYAEVDLLLAPTSPTTAFAFGEQVTDPRAMSANDICTVAANLTGEPAISVPFGNGADGLPVGVQIMAPARGEITMFRAARTLEAAMEGDGS